MENKLVERTYEPTFEEFVKAFDDATHGWDPSVIDEDNFYGILENLPYDWDFKYDAGVTKCCIIFKGWDFVLKFPFARASEYSNDYCEEEEEPGWTLAFQGANDGEGGHDYCLAEVYLWQDAVDDDVDTFFPQVELIHVTPSGVPLYKQERCKVGSYSDGGRRSKNDYSLLTREVNRVCDAHSFYNFNSVWIANAIDTYGEDRVMDLLHFCQTNHITDLHDGNLGYRQNGAPVIFDYGGFHD